MRNDEESQLFKNGRGKRELDSWSLRFKNVDIENGCEIHSTRIAIARKGPRLCELYGADGVDKEGFNTSGIISEHAIPFLFNGADLKDRIKLADEAIYHGTTFSRIYTVLLTGVALLGKQQIPKKEIKAVPCILTKDGRDHSLDSKLTFDVADLNELLIDDNKVPGFINGLIEDFLTLHKPFDVEFPIFYLKVAPEILEDAGKVKDFVYKMAGVEKAVSNVYCNNHYVNGVNLYNYSWLLTKEPYNSRNQIESNFVKVRVFPDVKRGRLAIVCYAPHLFPYSCICRETPLFTDPKIKDIWRRAWDAAPSLKHLTEDGKLDFDPAYKELKDEYRQYLISNKYPVEDERNWIYQLEEYEYHRDRSFVIFANYLLSFQKAQDLAKNIDEAVQVFGGEAKGNLKIDSADLSYLVGNQLGESFSQLLNQYYYNKEVSPSFSVYMETLRNDRIIPEKYVERYDQANREAMKKCCNVSELISIGFSNIHQFVELAGRRERFEDLNRLRFGESFSTFYTRAFAYLPEEELYSKIHQCIDFRIDNGSVVPKYVCQTDHPDKPWLRLFRSGENEDKMLEQQLRFFCVILDELYKDQEPDHKVDYISGTKIALAFNLILNQKLEGLEGSSENLLPVKYKVNYETLYRVPVIETEISAVGEESQNQYNRDVLSFCVDYGLLIPIEGNDNYRLSDADHFSHYRKDKDFFSESLYHYILEGIGQTKKVYDALGEDDTDELLNWLYISTSQLKKVLENLNNWINSLKSKGREATIMDVIEFYNVYKTFPVDYEEVNRKFNGVLEDNEELLKVFGTKWQGQLYNNKGIQNDSLYEKLNEKGIQLKKSVRELWENFSFDEELQDPELFEQQIAALSLE